MDKTEFLKKFKGQRLTCNECKMEFHGEKNKLAIGRTGKCFNCTEKRYGNLPIFNNKTNQKIRKAALERSATT